MGHYKRTLNDNFIEHLKNNYSFLIDCSYRKDNNYKYDVQFRPNNEIMIYFGGTCLLTAKYNEKTQQIKFQSKSYSTKCLEQFNILNKDPNTKNKKRACYDFLEKVSAKVGKKWNSIGSEGYWEQRISRLWGGSAWQEYMDFLVIDRQAIISFDTDPQKNNFYSGIKEKYIAIVKNLIKNNKWKKKNVFGDELDLLAIGPDKELLCIELKTAAKDSTFYYAPLQAAAYCEAFASTAHDISSDIKAMVQQKVDVGLLPKIALGRLPNKDFKVKSLLLVMDSSKISLDAQVWSRISEVSLKIDRKYRPSVIAIP